MDAHTSPPAAPLEGGKVPPTLDGMTVVLPLHGLPRHIVGLLVSLLPAPLRGWLADPLRQHLQHRVESTPAEIPAALRPQTCGGA